MFQLECPWQRAPVPARAGMGLRGGPCADSASAAKLAVSLPAPRHHYSFAQYLEVEEISEVRHEYYEGEIYAMAGGTPNMPPLQRR